MALIVLKRLCAIFQVWDKHIGKLRAVLGNGTISQDINLGWKEIRWGRTIFTERQAGSWDVDF